MPDCNDVPAAESRSHHEVLLESRAPLPGISRYLESVINQIQTLRYRYENEFDPSQAYVVLDKDLPNCQDKANKEEFINDIVRISEQFFQRSTSKTMNIKLEVINTDMCRLFHVDHYRQRLLCTYRGPGTQWLDHCNVNRDGLGKGCNTKILKDQHRINRAQPFEVLLIEGSKNVRGAPGVVHRSPPVEHNGLTRVLLKIDE